MKKYKILFWLAKKEHRRVYLSLKQDARVDIELLVHRSIPIDGFQVPVHRYGSKISGAIRRIRPDILFQCDTSYMIPLLKEYNIKHGYVNHGIWPHSPNNIGRVSNEFWMQFDILCGGSNMFKELFAKYSPTKALVTTSTLTQFDLLYNNIQNQEKIRQEIIIDSKNPSATKVITLFGHGCKFRKSLNPHNAGYYRAAVRLAKMAEKHNWLVVIKPKTTKIEPFLMNNHEPWANDIRSRYRALCKSKFVKFLHPHDDPYRYFCTDLIVCSARSTIEVEAALARKPLVRIKAPIGTLDDTDALYENGTLDFQSAYVVDNIKEMEPVILDALNGDNTALLERQEKFINHLGIIFDGKAHVRLIDHALEVLGKNGQDGY